MVSSLYVISQLVGAYIPLTLNEEWGRIMLRPYSRD
jgi:hypothetical protein